MVGLGHPAIVTIPGTVVILRMAPAGLPEALETVSQRHQKVSVGDCLASDGLTRLGGHGVGSLFPQLLHDAFHSLVDDAVEMKLVCRLSGLLVVVEARLETTEQNAACFTSPCPVEVLDKIPLPPTNVEIFKIGSGDVPTVCDDGYEPEVTIR